MQSFPFTSQVTYDEAEYPEYDRAVDSDILRNIFKNYYSNGVFPNPSTNFQVVADEGMQVVVRPGACLIEGATGYETEDRTMVVQAAGATDRIDSVVLRLNDNIDYRDIDLYVIKGNSSSEPPELTRTGGVYEIGLANLYVSANSSTITTERITDTRLVTARCGYAMPVQEFDTTALFDQLQAQVNENIELIQRAINQTEAAHLQEQIDSISSDIGTTSIASISDGTLKGAVAKHEQDVNSLNLKMDEVKYSTVQSANPEYISNVGGYICKQGNVCYMAVSFTILKTRDIGSLFKFSDYLAPKGASVIGHIYNNNTEAVCGFLFPTKAHANYNNGFIRNQASLSPGAYMLRVTWIDA